MSKIVMCECIDKSCLCNGLCRNEGRLLLFQVRDPDACAEIMCDCCAAYAVASGEYRPENEDEFSDHRKGSGIENVCSHRLVCEECDASFVPHFMPKEGERIFCSANCGFNAGFREGCMVDPKLDVVDLPGGGCIVRGGKKKGGDI